MVNKKAILTHRKVINNHGTLSVSLPVKWVRANNIVPGDVLAVVAEHTVRILPPERTVCEDSPKKPD